MAGGAWLQVVRARRLGALRQLRNGPVRLRGRGWIPRSLIGKAVMVETVAADPAHGSEVLSLVVEHVIPPHGTSDDALRCTGGQLRGRALYITYPTTRFSYCVTVGCSPSASGTQHKHRVHAWPEQVKPPSGDWS